MTQIRIVSFSGTPPLDIYISDYYGNNKTYLGQITGLTPPTIYEYPPSIFDYAPQVFITLSASNGCEVSKLVDGTIGCGFSFSLQEESCDTEIIIEDI